MVVDAADIIVPGRIVGINQRTRGGRLRAADKITACYLGGKYAIHRDINKCEIIRWNKGA